LVKAYGEPIETKGEAKVGVPSMKAASILTVVFRKSSDTDDEEDRIPKASYATLKEKAIRDMLKEYGLSTLGGRSQLEARHQQ
jgi:hypothetical protein